MTENRQERSAGKIVSMRRKTVTVGQAGRKERLYKKEDRQAGAGRQERLAGSCIRRKTGRQERLAGKIGYVRRKTGRLGQAGRNDRLYKKEDRQAGAGRHE
jgi:hypothetical protein